MTVIDLVRQAETDGRMACQVKIEGRTAPHGQNVILDYIPGRVMRFRVLVGKRIIYHGDDEDEAVKVFSGTIEPLI